MTMIEEQIPVPKETLERPSTSLVDIPNEVPSFFLGDEHRSYKYQFSNIYFVRLHRMRQNVERRARAKWSTMKGSPPLVPRVLEITKGQLCFIVGTVYMDMSKKPNVLEDVVRDRSIPAPPPPEKYHSPDDYVTLEDESGRVQLIGPSVRRVVDELLSNEEDGTATVGEAYGAKVGDLLVTGVIMAALGKETASGAFEVVDVCFSGMAPMMYKNVGEEDEMEVDSEKGSKDVEDEWIAFVSGLGIDEDVKDDLRIQMLIEYLSGESGGPAEQAAASRISRLIIAGNSLAPVSNATNAPQQMVPDVGDRRSKRFGQEASTFSMEPTHALGAFLLDVAQTMSVHLLVGGSDPSGTLLPQQPLPRAMFGTVKNFENFRCETNPVWIGVQNRDASKVKKSARRRAVLVHSGQALDDMFKYVPSPPTSRLDLAAASIKWRHCAPTAPDTLWCYPYFTFDPFSLKNTPDIYAVGCQPEFASCMLDGRDGGDLLDEDDDERRCRVVLVPKFKESGTLVLVNVRSLDVKTVEFGSRGILRAQDNDS